MSWKSGFSNGFSFEGPGIEGELPHCTDTLCGGRIFEVAGVTLLGALQEAYGYVAIGWHMRLCSVNSHNNAHVG